MKFLFVNKKNNLFLNGYLVKKMILLLTNYHFYLVNFLMTKTVTFF